MQNKGEIVKGGFYKVRVPYEIKNGKVDIKSFELLIDGESVGKINPYTLKGDTTMDREAIELFFGDKIANALEKLKEIQIMLMVKK